MSDLAGLWSFGIVLALATLGAGIDHALADDGDTTLPKRPAIQANRWAEDWSVLADPRLRTEPFDGLKYIPLWATDPKSYISLGATLRERFESNGAAGFGTGSTPSDSYFLQRLQVHDDMASTGLIENWIDRVERGPWFLYECTRRRAEARRGAPRSVDRGAQEVARDRQGTISRCFVSATQVRARAMSACES